MIKKIIYYMRSKIHTTLLSGVLTFIFFSIGFFAVLPSFLQSLTTYAANGAYGGACINGWSGTCLDVNYDYCGGSWVEGSYPWPCPYGGNSIWCCVPPPPIPPPTNVTGSCSASGTTATVNWTVPSGYTYSYARIHDETTNTECSYSGVITGSSFSCNSAVPGHRYSYWVHTTNSSGYPYSSEVPTAHTSSFTCPIPACGDAANPSGTVLSTGVPMSASSILNNDATNYGPANIVDGVLDLNKYWNSGRVAPGWVEINLGAPQEVSGLKLNVRQVPNGYTTTQILTGSAPNPTTNSRTLSCFTQDNQTVKVNFATSLKNVQYIRLNTSSSVSWVAWNEVTVYGAAPGKQTSTPGIIFSGDGSATFGQGNASTNNWIVGGLTYPELFKTLDNQSSTSYQYVLDKAKQGKIPITNLNTLSTCLDLSNCNLPANLQNGVYQANGDVRLNTYAFPANKNFVFLIGGNLTILGNMIVPNGSTAFFTAKNDIIINRNVGTATNLYPLPAGQLQGIFSADKDFVIDGINDCITGKDKMLNVEGAIVTNAFGQGGSFRTKRDLCGDNPKYPALTIRLRLDMLLNLPPFLMKQKTTFREEAP